MTRILVIDDEYVIRAFLAEILGYSGYVVDVAATAQEGLALFDLNHYALVISDLGLPEISGWDVAKAMKCKKPQIPFILLSGWGIEKGDPRLQECGIDLLLPKPCQMDDIIEAVTQVLNAGAGSTEAEDHLKI
jgi:DNA-binding response OmpR family regulator